MTQRFTHVFTTGLSSPLRERERARLQTTLTNKNEHFVCLTFFLLSFSPARSVSDREFKDNITLKPLRGDLETFNSNDLESNLFLVL